MQSRARMSIKAAMHVSSNAKLSEMEALSLEEDAARAEAGGPLQGQGS